MRNEERHIQDWMHFHALAGVEDFILYDNGSTDKTVELASAFPDLNVTILPWKFNGAAASKNFFFLLSQQTIAYSHAIATFGSKYRWIAFIDIDEIIFPKDAHTLYESLQSLEKFSNISLPWTMYGPNQHRTPPSEPQFFAYTSRARDFSKELLNFKCIVDPSKVIEVGIHYFRTSDLHDNTCNDTGLVRSLSKRNDPKFISRKNIQLNHYYTRSILEIEEKLGKGDACGFSRSEREPKVLKKLELIESSLIDDLSAIKFLERVGITSIEEYRSSVNSMRNGGIA
jgi:hypothetical protein